MDLLRTLVSALYTKSTNQPSTRDPKGWFN